MKQGNVSQKALGISGVILAILVLVGWYLYGAQKNSLQSLVDESQAMEQMLSEALDQSRNEIDSLSLSIQKLTGDLSAVQVSLTDEQRLRIELQADLAQTHSDKKQIEQNMQDKVQSITETTSELEKELQRQLSLQEKLDSEIGLVSDEKGELQARLENEQENQLRLQQQIERVMDDVGQKASALASAEQEAARLSQQLSQTREEQALLENRVEKLNQQREMDARHFAELEDRLKHELNESRIEISQFKNQMTVIKLTSEVLFNSGSAKIRPNGQKVLALIAESLNAYPDRAISIEGHTDNVPIGKRSSYVSNWELSTARAITVVRFLIRQGVPPYRLAATGFGEFQPLASADGEIAHRRNRRIEFKLTQK